MGARWSSTTKRVVVALFAIAVLYIVYRAGDIVRPLVWAGVLAVVLLPLVGLLERRLSLPRTAAAGVVFIGLLAAIIGCGRLLVPLYVGAKLRDEDPFPQLEQELEVAHPAPQARALGRRAHS